MKKFTFLLLILIAFSLFFKTPAFAQLPPIKDSATTIVGIGSSSGSIAPGSSSFYCQYGGVNNRGVLNNRRSWDYGSCSIEIGGCAPTSVAMVLTSLGHKVTPTEVSRVNGQIGCGNSGTSTSDVDNRVRPWVQSLGFKMTGNMTTGAKIPLGTAKNFIDRGYLILGGANVQWATSGGLNNLFDGHAFMITDVDVANKTVTVYDPTFCEGGFSGGHRVLRDVNTFSGNVRGWLWVYAIKN